MSVNLPESDAQRGQRRHADVSAAWSNLCEARYCCVLLAPTLLLSACVLRQATYCKHPTLCTLQVTVVLVSPRRPVSVGTVARALSSFEVEDMRIVAPREEYVTK